MNISGNQFVNATTAGNLFLSRLVHHSSLLFSAKTISLTSELLRDKVFPPALFQGHDTFYVNPIVLLLLLLGGLIKMLETMKVMRIMEMCFGKFRRERKRALSTARRG